MSAIDRFKSGLAEVNVLLNFTQASQTTLPDPAHGESLGLPDADPGGVTVRRAAVVLLVSHFEGFLKSVGEDLVDCLSTGSIEARKMPRRLREVHVLPKLAEVINCGNDDQRFRLLSKLSTISPLWTDAAKPPKGTLRAEVVTREIHNADSDCIDSLFFMFGAKESVCNGELDIPEIPPFPEESHDIRIRLSDIVKCRNDIAHGDMDRQPTAEDVHRYKLFLEYFAKRLQRRADKLAADLVGT